VTQLRQKHCPQCGYDLKWISNYFDDLLRGIGHRGSSFTDVDAVTHDGKTGRWLMQEFKQPTEVLSDGQQWHLEALSQHDRFTVWVVRKHADGRLLWTEFRAGATRFPEIITVAEYQVRFRAWWEAR
jgi:hypothetical protein